MVRTHKGCAYMHKKNDRSRLYACACEMTALTSYIPVIGYLKRAGKNNENLLCLHPVHFIKHRLWMR